MKIPRTYRINTERCTLRIVSEQDKVFIFSATKFKGFNDGMSWEAPESIEELNEFFQQTLQSWDASLAYTFTIECSETGTFIGRISLTKKEAGNNIWNLGYWTHPEQQRKGYMTEVAKAILELGFEVLKADCIEGYYALWNIGSEKVLKNIGMKFVRYIPQHFQKRGEWVAVNLLAIEREDWKILKET
jgi:[ribosomal protein S5]-alanine N-acetyltransferase